MFNDNGFPHYLYTEAVLQDMLKTLVDVTVNNLKDGIIGDERDAVLADAGRIFRMILEGFSEV